MEIFKSIKQKNFREYKEWPFYMSLCGMTILWMLVFSRLCQYWDYEDHIKIAQYLLIPEIPYSDLLTGIEITHILAYPIFHIVIKVTHLLLKIDYLTATIVWMTVAEIASVLIFRHVIKALLEIKESFYVDFISISLLVFEGARCWLNGWFFYGKQGLPNPLHNPTIIFVRPIAILCFYYFIKFFENYRENNRQLFYFGLTCLISVFIKPSFAVVFLPAMGIYTLISMIKNRDIIPGIKALIAVLPAVCGLLWQLHYMNSTSDIMKTIVHFGTYYDFSFKQVVGITLTHIPVVIILFSYRRIKEDAKYCVALIAYVIGWLQFFCLTQGGTQDYVWGYELALQMITMTSLCDARLLVDETAAIKWKKKLALLIFTYQVFNGLLYIYIVYKANDYRF